MPGISDHVRITVSRIRTAVSRVGFGTMLCMDAHRLFEDRYRAIASVRELQDAGGHTLDAAIRAATSYFAQAPAPRRMALGRRATGDTVTLDLAAVAVVPGGTYEATVGGLRHTTVAPGPSTTTAAMVAAQLALQLVGGYEITESNTATDYFEIAGLHAAEFVVGMQLVVQNSSAAPTNNGTYTLASVSEVAGNTRLFVTVVPTTEAPAAGTGRIGSNLAIIGVSAANETFTLSGDVRARFPVGLAFRVVGSTGNNAAWQVLTTALDGAGNTVITVTGNITDGTVDGGVVSAADGAGIALATRERVNATRAVAVVSLAPQTPGQFYTVRGDDKVRLGFTTTATPTADLNAVIDANNDFYGIMMTTRLIADVLSLAAQVQALGSGGSPNRKLLGVATSDANVINTTQAADDALTGSLPRRLQALLYTRTWCLFAQGDTGTTGAENNGDDFPEAAWFGRMLPTDPGASTWKFQTLTGIVASSLTANQRTNALAKNCNVYSQITADTAGTESGVVAEPEFIDVIVGLDWFDVRLQERVFTLLTRESQAGRKVPYTPKGVGAVEAEVRKQFDDAIAVGLIAEVPQPTVSVPATPYPAADRAARLLRNVTGRGQLAGAIHEAEVRIEVSV